MHTKLTVDRYHDISCGHRVVGHEGKCVGLHGHNYRVTFTCAAIAGARLTDEIGRVIDFGVIKSQLCMWLEDNWDHKMLLWTRDPLIPLLQAGLEIDSDGKDALASIVEVPFNPTAELMAKHLLEVIGPQQLAGTDVMLLKVVVEETRKCSAAAERE